MTRLSALLLLLCFGCTRGEIVSGTIESEAGFHYMAKFCYDYTPRPPEGMSDGSTMTLSIVMQADPRKPLPRNMRLYVFDDQPNSWPAVYKKNLPCSQMIAQSRNSTGIRFSRNGRWEMPLARIHEHVRPRFWYIVAANCVGFTEISYEIKFTNQGGSWKNQFGVNEQGLNTIYLVYFLVYGVGIMIHTYALRHMWQAGTLHPVVKLLAATIFVQFGSVFCGLVHYSSFTADGVGTPAIQSCGECLNICSRLMFVFLLILIAEGWTISTDEIKNRSFLFAVLGLFIVCYSALLLWDVTGRDPASTLYVYESVPGVLIVVLDLLTAVWFIVSIHKSHTEETDPKKSRLYEMIGFGFTIWFIALPSLVCIAAMMDPWSREKTVTAISLTVSTIAYSALAILLWPGRAEEYFKISTPDVSGSYTSSEQVRT